MATLNDVDRQVQFIRLILFILGAVLTTPEVITQVLMAVPLQILYEITVWIAWYWEEPDRKKANRKLALSLMGVVGAILLMWAAWRYGWPWLHERIGVWFAKPPAAAVQ